MSYAWGSRCWASKISKRRMSNGLPNTSLAPLSLKRFTSLSVVLPVTPMIGHVTPRARIAAVASGPLMIGITGGTSARGEAGVS